MTHDVLMTLVGGVFSVLMGLTLLIWPGRTLLVVAALLGIWLLLVGLTRIVTTFTTRSSTFGTKVLSCLAGLLYIVVGVICLRNLFDSVYLLAVMVGLVWIIGGAAEIFSAGSFPGKLLGGLTVAAGVIVLFWPGISLVTMTVVTGLWLIVLGIVQLVLWWTKSRSKAHGREVVA